MKRMLLAAGICLALGAGVGVVAMAGDDACETCPSCPPPATAPSTAPTTQAGPVNKMCPVMKDNPVDPAITVQYQGKTIGFCCQTCVAVFKADPEKYMKDLK